MTRVFTEVSPASWSGFRAGLKRLVSRDVALYAAAVAVLRADFIWLRDDLEVFWRAASLALPAGLLHDLGVGLLLQALIPARFRRWRVAILAALVALGSVNLSVLAVLSVPADPLMLTYVFDPFRTGAVESPVPVLPSLLRLLVAVGAFLALALGRGGARATAPSSRQQAISTAVVSVALLLGSRSLSGLDHRAVQVSHADGASWIWFQTSRVPFSLPPGTDLRRAILTPAASAGERFVSPDFPLLRGSPHALCRAGLTTDGCSMDADGDGASLSADCNDRDPAIRPDAEDLFGDGIDQDCDGLDAGAADVLILELEGLPARVLTATGGDPKDLVAPNLEALARREDARLFSRYETAATQTAPGFVSAACSLLPHYGAAVTRGLTEIHTRCLPAILKESGYRTRMVQNGDPRFDGQGAFARKIGFDQVEGAAEIERALGKVRRLTKWGLLDEALFSRLAQILGSEDSSAPRLILAQSVTNHHPYALPDPRYDRGPETTPTWRKVRATSRYVDEALGGFVRAIDELARKPGRRPILVVMSGDHGHPGERHPRNVLPPSALYEENVHTPLVVWSPGHPERLLALDGNRRDAPCSSVDVMPTVLGLLGIQAVHASMGRDLARPAEPEDERAVSLNPVAGGLIRIHTRDLTVIRRALPPGFEVYAGADRLELHEQGSQIPGAQEASEQALFAVLAAKELLETDRIWPQTMESERLRRVARLTAR